MKATTCKIISDASYNWDTKMSGYGVILKMNNLCIMKYGTFEGAENITEAEMMAAKIGLDYLGSEDFKKTGRLVEKVTFLCDNKDMQSVDDKNWFMVEKWLRSPKKNKRRIGKLASEMRAECHKYPRGCRVIHVKAHTSDGTIEDVPLGEKLDFHFNNWCDQSARKSLRYGISGEKVIYCIGSIDAYEYSVEVSDGDS